jgi:Tfp pilus assembly protein PilF
MLTSSNPVAMILPSQQEAQLFTQALAECNFRRMTVFTSAKEAYEVCTRQQFQVFVTRMEMPDMNGIVLIQKLRQTGNYGLEPHLFVCDRIDSKLLNIVSELDLDYVLVPPLTKAAAVQKFKHLITSENGLSDVERRYRDAKAALGGGLLEMAEDHVRTVLKAAPDLEKAHLLLGDVRAGLNDPTGARAAYQQALRVNPKSATAAHKLAQVLMSTGENAQAAEMLNRLAELSPYNIRLLENAGLSNLNIQQYDKAKAHMSKLSGLDETNKTAGAITAQVKIQTGDYDGLVDALKKSHSEKELIQFLNNAGAKLSKENDIDGALKMYAAALEQIEHSKFLYAIHYNMGIAYKRKEQFNKARIHFESSLKLKPDFDKAIAALAELASSAA